MPLKKFGEHGEVFEPYLHLKEFQFVLVWFIFAFSKNSV